MRDHRPVDTLAGRSPRVRVGSSSESDSGGDGEGEGGPKHACGGKQTVMTMVRVKAAAAVRERVEVISEGESTISKKLHT